MKLIKKVAKQAMDKKMLILLGVTMIAFMPDLFAQAGSAAAGISKANNDIKALFPEVDKLMLAIGGIVGLIGGIRVYIKWNNGDQDVTKAIMGWGGAALFLAISGFMIKEFFGL